MSVCKYCGKDIKAKDSYRIRLNYDSNFSYFCNENEYKFYKKIEDDNKHLCSELSYLLGYTYTRKEIEELDIEVGFDKEEILQYINDDIEYLEKYIKNKVYYGKQAALNYFIKVSNSRMNEIKINKKSEINKEIYIEYYKQNHKKTNKRNRMIDFEQEDGAENE